MPEDTMMFVDRDAHTRPERFKALRNGKSVWLMVEPNHPRFSFSMGPAIKRVLDEEDRYALAEKLAPHVGDALAHWPDEPILVSVPSFGMTFTLCDNPDDPGKVLVRIRD